MSEQLAASPTNHVTAVLHGAAQAEQLASQVRSETADQVTVSVLGPEDHDEVTIDPDEDGPIARLVAGVRSVLGEETSRLSTLADALNEGSHVLCVALPTPTGTSDAEHEALLRRVADLLDDGGATAVTYHGQWGIADLSTDG